MGRNLMDPEGLCLSADDSRQLKKPTPMPAKAEAAMPEAVPRQSMMLRYRRKTVSLVAAKEQMMMSL